MRTDGRAQAGERGDAVDADGRAPGRKCGQRTATYRRPVTTVTVVPLWDRRRTEVRG
ncbi:hypothetical protein [Streptomyces sp. NPDC088794]|uniref:hypothetical protein n=1 Tax=Streptomyces sp. NPDC088794 TaxID=3365902 RepID=UPI00381ED962